MSDTSDSDDEGGWPFLRRLLRTSLIDDLWGMDHGMVGSTTGSRAGCPLGHRTPSRPNSVVQKDRGKIKREPAKVS